MPVFEKSKRQIWKEIRQSIGFMNYDLRASCFLLPGAAMAVYSAAAMTTKPAKKIESFQNPNPGRNYVIEVDCPEFTCLCPITGQPDFAHFRIKYIPDALCLELKSLKLYLWSYRDEGAFHEAVTNRILEDIVGELKPRWMEVKGTFNVRGGIATSVTATHGRVPEQK